MELRLKYGYIDSRGQSEIPFIFDEAFDFREGLARVRIDDRYGFIDKRGRFVIPPVFDKANDFSDGVAIVKFTRNDQTTLFGVVDSKGRLTILHQYVFISDFSEGKAVACGEDGFAEDPTRFGYINANGKQVIPAQFLAALPFSDGLAAVATGEKQGYINKDGEWVFVTDYDEIFPFAEGCAPVKTGNLFGYIDRNGKEIMGPRYTDARGFQQGYALVALPNQKLDKRLDKGLQGKNGAAKNDDLEGFVGDIVSALGTKYGFIDKRGNWLVSPKSTFLCFGFSDGLASMCEARPTGGEETGELASFYINRKGKKAFRQVFEMAGPFMNGFAKVMKRKKTGIINVTGNLVYTLKELPGSARDKRDFLDCAKRQKVDRRSQRFVIRENGLEGVIDEKGHVVCPCKYDRVQPFCGGYAVVMTEGWFGLIDRNGQELIAPKYAFLGRSSSQLHRFWREGKWGFVDPSGQVVIQPEFDYAFDFREGLAVVLYHKQFYYIDRKGHKAFKKAFEYAEPFNSQLAVVRSGEQWYYIDRTGNRAFSQAFEWAAAFDSEMGVACVMQNDKFGVIDGHGVFIIPAKCRRFPLFSSGLIHIPKGNTMAIYDTKGKRVLPKSVKARGIYSDGVICVMTGERVLFFDSDGKFMFKKRKPRLSLQVDTRPGGLADLFVSKLFETVVDALYGKFSEGLAPFYEKGRWGFWDRRGNVVIRPVFRRVTGFCNGLAAVVLKDGRDAYIDKTGRIVWQQNHALGTKIEFNNSLLSRSVPNPKKLRKKNP